jgi:hypothetical protein
MVDDRPPRLRYFWQFTQHVSNDPGFQAALGGGRFLPEHRRLGLRYELDKAAVRPSSLIASAPIGRSAAFLYALGHDEFLAETLWGAKFPASFTAGWQAQGLLIIRTRYRFDARASAASEAELFNLIDRYHQIFYDHEPKRDPQEKLKPGEDPPPPPEVERIWPVLYFYINAVSGKASPRMQKILVLFQLHFGLPGDGMKGDRDISVYIALKDGSLWGYADLNSDSLELATRDIDIRLHRFALGLDPSAYPSVDPSELTLLARFVAATLGDPPQSDGSPTRIVSRMP